MLYKFCRTWVMGRTWRKPKLCLLSEFYLFNHLLGFTWNGAFYHDKWLAMGAASSCRTFEIVNTALEWITCNKCKSRVVIHILDEFLFIAPSYDET